MAVTVLPAKLTDSTGGSASSTLAAATNTDAITDNTSGTPSASSMAALTGVDGTGSNAAPLTTVRNNFATVAAELALQRSLNTVLINAVASLSSKVNSLLDAQR